MGGHSVAAMELESRLKSPSDETRPLCYWYWLNNDVTAEVGGGPGTYIIQAKGKHHGHVNVDPALCLIMARKVIKEGETCFDLYREEITKQGGIFSNGGRRYVKLTP